MYQSVYVNGMRHLLATFPGAFPLYTSSTSVFPQIDGETVDETSFAFFIDEPKFEKERAYYVIGIGRTILRDWQIQDKLTVSKEVGLALLNYYNRKGMDIDKLVWNQYPGPDDDNRRLLQVAEVPETLQQFFDQLLSTEWSDKFVEQGELSQDIRRGRPQSALYR